MMLKRNLIIQTVVGTSALILLLACSGSGGTTTPTTTPKASALEYTDPTGTGWRLVKGAASTPTHLVLELKAPAATAGLGVGLKLTLDPTSARWAKVAAQDGTYVKNAAYDLGTDTTSQLIKAKANSGDLTVGAYQKGTANPVTYSGAILSVSMDFKSESGINAGTTIPLLVSKAQHVSADGSIVDLQSLLQVGMLKAQ